MSRTLLLTLLILSSFAFQGQAALGPCEIDMDAFAATFDDFTPRIGESICPDALINLPNVAFEPGEDMIAPNIIWLIYEDIPITGNPNSDPGNLNVFLQDSLGNIIFGDGMADLSQNSIFDSFDDFKDIYLVPIIIPDSINGGNIFDPLCTGIVASFNYPAYRLLDPTSHPDVCDGADCPDEFLEADDCIGAISIDLNNLEALKEDTVSNFCATSVDDPTLPANNGCFFYDDTYAHTVWFQFAGTGATYDIQTLNCQRADKDALGFAQITVFSGACNNLEFVACAEDPNGLALIDELKTLADTDYYIVIDGFGENKGDFCLDMIETVPVTECIPLAGDLDISGTEFCVGNFAIDIVGSFPGSTYSDLVYAVSDDAGFAGILTEGPVDLAPGTYNMFVYNYLTTDEQEVVDALNTGGPEELSNLIENGVVCAGTSDLAYIITILEENDPACIDCEANFGTINPPAILSSCEGESFFFTTTGDATGDYRTTFLVVQGDNIVFNSGDGSISGLEPGTYSVHALNYLIADEMAIGFAIQIGANVNELVTLLQGDDCGVLSEGISITVLAPTDPECTTCEADYGTVIVPNDLVACVGTIIPFSVEGNNTTSEYASVYILTQEGIISGAVVSGDINLPVGEYTVHAFNYLVDDNDLVSDLVTEGLPASGILDAIASGELCADLEVPGTTVTILASDDPACVDDTCEADYGTVNASSETTVCQGSPLSYSISGSAADGFTTYVVVTTGAELAIVDAVVLGETINLMPGTYTFHAFNFANENETAILNLLGEDDVRASNVVALIEDGTICAELDVTGVTFTILAEDDPACFECDADFAVSLEPFGPLCEADGIPVPLITSLKEGYTFTWVITTGEDLEIVTTANGNIVILDPGTYTIHSFNYLDEDESVILDALAMDGITGGDVLALIDNGSICASLDVVGMSFTILSGDDPACVEETCEADFMVDVEPLGAICEGELAELPMVTTTDGYTFTWVITTGEDLTILTTVNGSFSLEPGDYTVHGFNYLSTDEAAILAALALDGITGGDVLALIEDGTICASLDAVGVPVTFLAADDPTCFIPDPLAYEDEVILNGDGTYSVIITISGGNEEYLVDGASVGNVFMSDPIPCGEDYSFLIADTNGDELTASGTSPCVVDPPCETSAGSLSDEGSTLIVCEGDNATLVANGSTLEEGDILTYILHDGDENMFGEAIAVSADGTFNGADLTPNIPYYVVAAAGPTDADGNILIGDECTSLSIGKPVVFLQEITITTNVACNQETGLYQVTFAVTGGLPAYDNSLVYTVSGIHNGTANFGENITTNGIPGGTSFTVNAIDGNGCSGIVTNDGPTCKEPSPIELIRFEGEVQTTGNLLEWSTASEFNNEYFVLERSVDGIDFETVAMVESKGEGTRLQDYEWFDKYVVSGVSYYRLQQVDYDGQFTYSDIIALERGEVELGFTSIAPIPVIDRVSVSFTTGQSTTITMNMYDLLGKLIMTRVVEAENGINEIAIDMTDFSPGIYFIALEDGEKRMVDRVMKK